MTRTLQVPRSRGGISGALLVLLGLWGALIPFVGPYFDYAYAPPSNTWNYTNARLIFEILPGVATALGGVIILTSGHRVLAMLGGGLAALGGAWFVVGVPLAVTWDSPSVGSPTGGTTRQVLEYLGFFGGLGVVIVFLAAFAWAGSPWWAFARLSRPRTLGGLNRLGGRTRLSPQRNGPNRSSR